jgi:hypothetical protein
MIWFSTCIVMLPIDNRGLSLKSTNGTERKAKLKERNEYDTLTREDFI